MDVSREFVSLLSLILRPLATRSDGAKLVFRLVELGAKKLVRAKWVEGIALLRLFVEQSDDAPELPPPSLSRAGGLLDRCTLGALVACEELSFVGEAFERQLAPGDDGVPYDGWRHGVADLSWWIYGDARVVEEESRENQQQQDETAAAAVATTTAAPLIDLNF